MKSFFNKFLKGTTQYMGSQSNATKTTINNNINRITLKGNQKTQTIQAIEQIVFQAQFQPITSQMQDICEEVHYQVMNDKPIRVDYLKKLLPNVNFNTYNEEQYNEWLRYKHNLDSYQSEVTIDNTQNNETHDKSFSNMSQTNQQINQQDVLNSYKKNLKK